MVRLDALLSEVLGIPQKAAAELIRAGEVSVGGADGGTSPCTEPRWQVVLGEETAVHLRGAPLLDGTPGRRRPFAHRVLLLHKPRRCLCERKRPPAAGAAPPPVRDVWDLVPPALNHATLGAFGRLDVDTTGLLLMGTDGGLQSLLMHPSSRCQKAYVATLRVQSELRLRASAAVEFASGTLTLADGHVCRPAELEVLETVADPTDPAGGAPFPRRVRVTLHEGQNHQVKRMLGACGAAVEALHRERIGSLSLATCPAGAGLGLDLPEGGVREATEAELRLLHAMVPAARVVAKPSRGTRPAWCRLTKRLLVRAAAAVAAAVATAEAAAAAAAEEVAAPPPTFTSCVLDSDDLLSLFVAHVAPNLALRTALTCTRLKAALEARLRNLFAHVDCIVVPNHCGKRGQLATFVEALPGGDLLVSDSRKDEFPSAGPVVQRISWERRPYTSIAELRAAEATRVYRRRSPDGVPEATAVHTWDCEAMGQGAFKPSGLVVDGSSFFVACAERLQVYQVALEGGEGGEGSGQPRLRTLRPPAGSAQLRFPLGCARSAASGLLFVVDSDGDCIVALDSTMDGSPGQAAVAQYAVIGSTGEGEGQLRDPYDVAVRDGRLYVSDSSNSRISIFDERHGFAPLGSLRCAAGGPLTLSAPAGLAFMADGRLIVATTVTETLLAETLLAGRPWPGDPMTNRKRRVRTVRGYVRIITLSADGLAALSEQVLFVGGRARLGGVCVNEEPTPRVFVVNTLAHAVFVLEPATLATAHLLGGDSGSARLSECVWFG